MECYAPLLVNVNPGASEWPTNLIGYDALSSFGSPSYYAQCMLAQNRGDQVLPAKLSVEKPVAVERAPAPHGAVGLGSWHTDAEYKDVSITHGDQTLLAVDPAKGTEGWKFTGGNWGIADSSIKALKTDAETWAVFGDPSWTDYTIRLKARKNGGAEGFLILYHAVDGDNYHWWNVGGWGNTRTEPEAAQDGSRAPFGKSSDFTVETGKWYDLRVEVTGSRVRGFVDDRLVSDVTEDQQPASAAVYASATYDNATHEVIAKLVNFGDEPVDATVKLAGGGQINPTGRAIVLSGSPRDRNSVAEPMKVAPREESIGDASATFHRAFPAHSLTILRLGAAAAP
jgi:alpha-L-arabinofuranosidase